MEESSTSDADIPGEGKQFTGIFKDPDDMPEIHVPDKVPVKIGDQTIGVARTKQVPGGIEFDMKVDWTEDHLVRPLLPAEFSFDREPPERFSMARPYVNLGVLEEKKLRGLNTGYPGHQPDPEQERR